MSVEELEHFTKDQLIEELINRPTFVGIVLFHRGDAKAGRLEPGEIVMTTSPPLKREGVESLLAVGQSLVVGMFGEESATATKAPAEELDLHAHDPALRWDEGGVVRVGKSRVSLDVVVEQYENGATPEAMARAYDTLIPADVYAAIAYYLRHRDQVRAYLKRRAAQADSLRVEVEAQRPRIAREELLNRCSGREQDHAPTGQ